MEEKAGSNLTSSIKSVKELLCFDNLSIPSYQRPYKWTEKNVLQLIDDILDNIDKSEYRLGTIITHRSKESKEVEGVREILDIVDGQQRTITIFLIALAIIELYKSKGEHVFDNMIPKSGLALHGDISKANAKTALTLIRQNLRRLAREDNDQLRKFTNTFYYRCNFDFIEIDDLAEAFQLFDSQNARGKDLEPHDLLKAYHLRVMNIHSTENDKRDAITGWESYAPSQLSELFGSFMYRIRRWSKQYPAMEFTKGDVDEFKGLDPDPPKDYLPYAMIYMIAHHYLVEYNKSAARMITRAPFEFPFQLDQQIVNGKRFFEMVEHYSILLEQLESKFINRNTENETVKAIFKSLDSRRSGDSYLFKLFECALLFCYDRFGTLSINSLIDKLFIWTYALRLQKQQIKQTTIDNHACGLDVKDNGGGINIFRLIHEAKSPRDILAIHLPTTYTKRFRNVEDAIIKRFEDFEYVITTN